MKKKLFINIFSLLCFVFFVAFIWPKISEMLEAREKQAAIVTQIADLNKKAEIIESLSQKLSGDMENQEAVLQYIPSIKGDEFLINYLNSVTYAEGVTLNDAMIEEKISVLPLPVENLALTDSGSEAANALPVVAISPKPVFETANFNFFTSYEKVLTLLKKFDGLKRSNEVVSLKIIKTYPKDNEGDASLNFLQVDLGLDFNYLKKIDSQAEISENIFNKESFDQDTLTKIKTRAINEAIDPDSKTDGRSNPFIL
jgi:hypothetical protein